jgi:hypothetical protein
MAYPRTDKATKLRIVKNRNSDGLRQQVSVSNTRTLDDVAV